MTDTQYQLVYRRFRPVAGADASAFPKWLEEGRCYRGRIDPWSGPWVWIFGPDGEEKAKVFEIHLELADVWQYEADRQIEEESVAGCAGPPSESRG